MRIRLDDGVRRSGDRRTLIGGSPFGLFRSSERQARDLDRLLEGTHAGGDDDAVPEFVSTLVERGVLHPVVDRLDPEATIERLAAIDVVVASRDNADGLADLLAALPLGCFASVTVIDDGSDPPIDQSVDSASFQLIRHSTSQGPAAARNRGAAAGAADLLLFIDDDITFGASDPVEVIGGLMAWCDRADVAAAAPRVRTGSSGTVLGVYEGERGVFDLGPNPSRVAPNTRVPYVPTAMLMVRRDAFVQVGGFDSMLLRGEDVDLVWRFVAAGRTVRYEPSVAIEHPVRPTLASWLEQRRRYGRSTSELASVHPGSVYALDISPWSAGCWLLLGFGGRWRTAAGLALWAVTTAALVPRLRGLVDEPGPEAGAIAGKGTMLAGAAIAETVRRSWAPLVLASMGLGWARRVSLGAWIIAPLAEWRAGSRTLGPIRWLAIRAADDTAYCCGVWQGAIATRSLRALALRWQRRSEWLVDLSRRDPRPG